MACHRSVFCELFDGIQKTLTFRSETMDYDLPKIPYLRLRCTLRAEEEALLPGFKGSMLRGAFGHALRRAACAMGPKQPCETCGLRSACLYTRLFETFLEEGTPPPFLRGQREAPRPFVFEAEEERRHFAPGDRLRFDLLLFGSAVGLQALAVMAVARMAERGLGERRRRFAVEVIAYQDALGDFRPVVTPGPLAPPVLPPRNGLPEDGFTLYFRTPARFKTNGHLVSGVGFRDFTFRALARVLELAHFFGDRAAVDWNFQSLLRQTDGVRVVDQRLVWQDLKRYSSRQRAEMCFGGFMGSMRLEGDLTPFAPLLRTAEIVHIGKGATFGLGRVEIAAEKEES